MQYVQQDNERKKRKLAPAQTILPGEDEEDLDERGFQRSDRGPMKDVDPEYAAKRRAALRATHRRTTLDVSVVPDDVAAAEEDYDEPEELFLSGSIPVEPFHLRREREEGFFDQAGNYIEYRNQEARDAWLDGLDDMDPNQRVEGSLASRLMDTVRQQHRQRRMGGLVADGGGEAGQPGAASRVREGSMQQAGYQSDGEQGEDDEVTSEDMWQQGGAEEEGDGPVMDPEDVVSYKRRIIALLQSGEDVLSALRRLGARPAGEGGGVGAGAGAADGGSLGNTAARQRARKLQRDQAQEQQARSVVEAGSGSGPQASKGTAGLEQTSASVGQGADVAPQGGPAGQQGDAGGAVTAGPKSRPGTPGQQQIGKASSHKTSVDFERLVEYADLLLSAGVLTVYHKTREELVDEVAVVQRAAQQPQQQNGVVPADSSQADKLDDASAHPAAPPAPVDPTVGEAGQADTSGCAPQHQPSPSLDGSVDNQVAEKRSELQQLLAGFEQVVAPAGVAGTQLFYNSNLGVWYNVDTKLFMDANTGRWYRITSEGQHEWVGQAGVGLPQAQAAAAQ